MENKEITSTPETKKAPVERTIDPELAYSYVENWKKGQYQIVPSTVIPALGQLQLNSFSFSIADFEDLSKLIHKYNNKDKHKHKITRINCRIGLKPNLDGPFTPYMYFEPILEGEKRLPMVPSDDGSLSEETFVSACYDVCYPCPPTCPIPGV